MSNNIPQSDDIPIIAPYMDQPPIRWSSERLFIFATIGAAVGLGNLWRFPYLAGENGGAAFVLAYLVAVLLFGIPLMEYPQNRCHAGFRLSVEKTGLVDGFGCALSAHSRRRIAANFMVNLVP